MRVRCGALRVLVLYVIYGVRDTFIRLYFYRIFRIKFVYKIYLIHFVVDDFYTVYSI